MTYLLGFIVTGILALLYVLYSGGTLALRKAVRIVLVAPIALPLVVLGWLLSFVWANFGLLALIGMWLLGIEVVIG